MHDIGPLAITFFHPRWCTAEQAGELATNTNEELDDVLGRSALCASTHTVHCACAGNDPNVYCSVCMTDQQFSASELEALYAWLDQQARKFLLIGSVVVRPARFREFGGFQAPAAGVPTDNWYRDYARI